MSSSVKLTYHGDAILAGLEQVLNKRLHKVGVLVSGEIRRNIGDSTRANGPSGPGGFPHADTGTLRKSISFVVDRQAHEVRIGTPVIYGRFLEDGTGHMEPRPFLRRTVRDLESRIIRILKPRIKGSVLGGKLMES
jgi:HK97 gp10 family phage protein